MLPVRDGWGALNDMVIKLHDSVKCMEQRLGTETGHGDDSPVAHSLQALVPVHPNLLRTNNNSRPGLERAYVNGNHRYLHPRRRLFYDDENSCGDFEVPEKRARLKAGSREEEQDGSLGSSSLFFAGNTSSHSHFCSAVEEIFLSQQ